LHKLSTDPLDRRLAACLRDSPACQIFRDGVGAVAGLAEALAMDLPHEVERREALLALEILLPFFREIVFHEVAVAARAPAIRFEGHGISRE
jgi:hypothetical protein